MTRPKTSIPSRNLTNMKTPGQLLNAYESTVVIPGPKQVDQGTWMILIWAIYDDRSGEWIHDFLVKENQLPAVEGKKRKNQIRKVHNWRAAVEAEIGLEPRKKGRPSAQYHAGRQRWKVANPRPSAEMLLAGWQPVAVDYTATLPGSTSTPDPEPITKPAETQTESPQLPDPSEVRPDGKPGLGKAQTPEEAYNSLSRNPDESIKIEPGERKLANLESFRG